MTDTRVLPVFSNVNVGKHVDNLRATDAPLFFVRSASDNYSPRREYRRMISDGTFDADIAARMVVRVAKRLGY